MRAGPLVLDGLDRSGAGRVLRTTAVVEPGTAVTVAVAAGDRDRAGLLEGCSDTTAGGGAARFEGGIVRRGDGCVSLRIHAGGEVFRRRVGC